MTDDELNALLERFPIESVPRPLGDRVLLVRDAAAEKSEGGIALPAQAQEKPQVATVLNRGPKATVLLRGDRVFFTRYAGTAIEWGKQELLLLAEDDALAALPEGGGLIDF